MNFIFSGQKQYFTPLSALVRKILFCHSKIKFISSHHRVISSMYIILSIMTSENVQTLYIFLTVLNISKCF